MHGASGIKAKRADNSTPAKEDKKKPSVVCKVKLGTQGVSTHVRVLEGVSFAAIELTWSLVLTARGSYDDTTMGCYFYTLGTFAKYPAKAYRGDQGRVSLSSGCSLRKGRNSAS